jgi:hypothetical protein
MPPKKAHNPSTSAASASSGRNKKKLKVTEASASAESASKSESVKSEDIHKLDGTNDEAVTRQIKSELLKDKNTMVYTFGRFQPPTIGHGLLIENIVRLANTLHADHGIYVSKSCNDLEKYKRSKIYNSDVFESCDANKNPLNVYQKIYYMSYMFRDVNSSPVNLYNTDALFPGQPVSPFHVLNFLSQYYGNLIILLGSDRIGESGLINGLKKSAHDRGVNLIFVSVGKKRDEKSDSVEGMSGTKLRELAVANNFDKFFEGVNTGMMTRELAHKMMNDVRVGLAIDPVPYTQQGGVYLHPTFHKKIKVKRGKRKSKSSFML